MKSTLPCSTSSFVNRSETKVELGAFILFGLCIISMSYLCDLERDGGADVMADCVGDVVLAVYIC